MSDLLKILLDFFTALFVTFLVLPRLAKIAAKLGLIDHPGGRKAHSAPRPLVGGIGIMIGISISLLLFVPLQNLRGYYAGLLVLAIVGFLDDFTELYHIWKFAAQILAALFMVYFSNTILSYFGDLLAFGRISFDRAAILLTIFSVVGVINAINMSDGIDGLAGALSFTAFSSFALLAFLNDQRELMLLSAAFCGALVAFLRFNWYPSRLFMGDAGSMTLGFTITFLSIALTQKTNSRIPPVVPLLIVAVPIVDTLTVMTKRMLKGGSPFQPDRTHLHHIFLSFGLTEQQTAIVIVLVSSLFSFVGILAIFLEIPEYYLFYGFLAYFLLYFSASLSLGNIFKYIKGRKPEGSGGKE